MQYRTRQGRPSIIDQFGFGRLRRGAVHSKYVDSNFAVVNLNRGIRIITGLPRR